MPGWRMISIIGIIGQANNNKLNFARGFLRRLSLFISCWKEVINLTLWSFSVLSAMIVDTVSGTTAAIFWQWRKDLQDYRDVDSKILWPLNQFLIFITQTLNSTTSQLGQYLNQTVSSHGCLFFIQIDFSSPPQGGCLWPPSLKSDHSSESCSDTLSGYIFKLALRVLWKYLINWLLLNNLSPLECVSWELGHYLPCSLLLSPALRLGPGR